MKILLQQFFQSKYLDWIAFLAILFFFSALANEYLREYLRLDFLNFMGVIGMWICILFTFIFFLGFFFGATRKLRITLFVLCLSVSLLFIYALYEFSKIRF